VVTARLKSSHVHAQVLFRSVNKLLMDTATSEYLFCADFFGEDAVFHELFGPTLSAVEAHLSSTVQVCAVC
jgi:vacuolar protein sorting-associated protein 52